MAIPSGSRLGPYEVLAPLGAGGMGEVYRARDTRLEREVAVKVLPEQVAKDLEALARFEREARTVAGLNDPHVCSLFDVGVEDTVHYAVFELLKGDTLRERLARGALSAAKVIELAIQLCGGLAAAHAEGVVHRDLKPANLFLTRQGLKILDFGLAKVQPVGGGAWEAGLSEQETLSAAEQLTSPGVAPGTVAYMSPEQARGEPADARSDIFATGVVLFEMLSGERPFRRDTPAETLTAIIREDPSDLRSPIGPVPPGLERITRRCLEKDPEDRFQSAHDLAFALEAVSGTSAPVRPRPSRSRRWIAAGTLVAATVIAAIGGFWAGWPREPPPPLRVRPITSDPGSEWYPALSPDGHRLAFVRVHEAESALYVKLIDGGDPLLLTRSAMETCCPAWSPDGLKLAFVRHVEGEDGELADGIFVVPALGGAARGLGTSRGHRHGLAWSPDGATLAVSDQETPEEPVAIFLLSLDTGGRQRLTSPPDGSLGDSVPRFSPDGRTLAFIRAADIFDTDVYVIPAEGGTERRLTVGNLQTEALDWAPDGRSIIFSSWRQGGAGAVSLWRVRLPGGDSEPLAFGEGGSWPSISRASGRLAYVREEGSTDVWRVGGPGTPEGERSATRLISSTRMDYHARYSPDGKRIAFASLRSGAAEVWVCDSDGSNPRQVTFLDEPMAYFPTWSPDGKRIAFTSVRDDENHAYVVNASGGVPRRLTPDRTDGIAFSWARDGRWIYVGSQWSGKREVWKVPPDGGDAVQVTTHGGTWAVESHDGRCLYLGKSTAAGGPPGIWRIPVGGGEEIQVLDRAEGTHWALLERGILYLDSSPRPRTLELLEFETGEVTRIAVVELPYLTPGFSVSPDDRWVLISGWSDVEADIMLVESFE